MIENTDSGHQAGVPGSVLDLQALRTDADAPTYHCISLLSWNEESR